MPQKVRRDNGALPHKKSCRNDPALPEETKESCASFVERGGPADGRCMNAPRMISLSISEVTARVEEDSNDTARCGHVKRGRTAGVRKTPGLPQRLLILKREASDAGKFVMVQGVEPRDVRMSNKGRTARDFLAKSFASMFHASIGRAALSARDTEGLGKQKYHAKALSATLARDFVRCSAPISQSYPTRAIDIGNQFCAVHAFLQQAFDAVSMSLRFFM